MRFKDRTEAGQKLAKALAKYKGEKVVVYAIPRGGVVLGVEIAKALGASLDLVITRKIGHPSNPEYAVCVIAEDKDLLCDEAERKGLDPKWLAKAMEKERLEAKRRREVYLKSKTRPEVGHKKPARLIAAVPVMPAEMIGKVKAEADELVALDIDANYLGAVGAYYDDFPQVSDEEVIGLLQKSPMV